jgi:acid phosphatase
MVLGTPRLASALTLAVALSACATARSNPPAPPVVPPSTPSVEAPAAEDPTLYATLWIQTSAEYRASAWQAYAAARSSLERALADSTWTAAIEQEGTDFGRLPPAIILDVDETVLDNSPNQARLIRSGGEFDPDSWEEWVEESRAPPVPGAPEFLTRADSLGVTVFYVTNRDAPTEAATRRNLAAAGLPLDPDVDTVLVRGEREEWASDKSSRRQAVAERYRVVLLVGDDFNDFVPANLPRAERDRLVERYRDRWGERWIVLPNPTYGSWERALYSGATDPDEADRARLRLEALEDLRP